MFRRNRSAPQAEAQDGLDPALLRLALTLVVGSFATLLDSTIVSVSLNQLHQYFNTSLATIQWVTTGYLLALSAVIPLSGWAVTRFGQKTMWMFSVTLFLVASVLSGLAWSAESLIVFRVLQGFGGGMIQPLALTILVQAAGRARTGRVMSIITVPANLAPIVGPVVGGLIVGYLSWRWLFFVNVPICIVGLVMAQRYVQSGGRGAPQRLDILGMALLSPGIAAMVYGLSLFAVPVGGRAAATAWLVGGALLLAVYLIRSLRPNVAPVVDVRLLRTRSFAAASALMFLFGVSLFGALFLLPLYYTQGRDQTPIVAGLLLAPQGIGALAASRSVIGRMTDRLADVRRLLLGCVALASLGTVPYVFVGHDVNEVLLGISLVVRGFGLGGAMIVLNAVAFRELSREAIPAASSVINIVLRVGASFGTAVLAVILQRELAGQAADLAGRMTAFGNTFLLTLVLTGVAIIPAFFLPVKRPAAAAETPAPQGQPAAK